MTETPEALDNCRSLRAFSFSLDPLTDVRRAVLQFDIVRLAALEKLYGISIHEGQVSQIQDYAVPARFYFDHFLQFS